MSVTMNSSTARSASTQYLQYSLVVTLCTFLSSPLSADDQLLTSLPTVPHVHTTSIGNGRLSHSESGSVSSTRNNASDAVSGIRTFPIPCPTAPPTTSYHTPLSHTTTTSPPHPLSHTIIGYIVMVSHLIAQVQHISRSMDAGYLSPVAYSFLTLHPHMSLINPIPPSAGIPSPFHMHFIATTHHRHCTHSSLSLSSLSLSLAFFRSALFYLIPPNHRFHLHFTCESFFIIFFFLHSLNTTISFLRQGRRRRRGRTVLLWMQRRKKGCFLDDDVVTQSKG